MPQEIIGPLLSIGAALELPVIGYVLLALVLAGVVSFATTPLIKALSVKVGAIDVPRDGRRMHDHPIPRMGGLAIFLGFIISVLLLMPLDQPKQGMLLGAVIIVVLGIFDDIYALSAKLKFVVQIAAACVAVFSGNRIEVLSNPNIFSSNPYWELGVLSVPVTIIWIVALTNAVNLIDGLDGLACGVSTISSVTTLVIALLVSEGDVAVMMGALAGACIGFLPYNLNPAKIFMGDTGATFLGYILGTVSVNGMFKLPTIISFVVPFLILGLPIFDVCFAVVRRLAKGQSPMSPDRSHIHHRLIDMDLSQKQAVGILYVISAILGLSAVVLTASTAGRAMIFLAAMAAAGLVAAKLFLHNDPKSGKEGKRPPEAEGPAGRGENSGTENESEQSSAQGEEDRNG